MERLTFNMGVRKTVSQKGREVLTAPMVILKVQVLNGSQGSLFYPEQEIRRSVPKWNNIPIVVNHPTGPDGRPISAKAPGGSHRRIGTVRNAQFDGYRLTATAEIDVAEVKRIDSVILIALEQDQPLEVSTGLMTTNDQQSGTFEGVPFTAIARDYQPDHLAVLPGQVGACSLKDGCGLAVNQTE